MSTFFTLDDGEFDAAETDFILFKTANEFSMFIINTANKSEQSLVKTICDYCEARDIETSDVAKLISKSLKELIAVEMQELGLLKKESTAEFDD